VLPVWLTDRLPETVWLAVVDWLVLRLCVKEVVGHALASPVDVREPDTEGDADAVCVMVSLTEAKEAEADPL
jgi:hypothetical protein